MNLARSFGVMLLASVWVWADAPKPAPKPLTEAAATPATALKTLPGFKVELIYSVPKETQGSWVNLCVDPKGRLVTSDQYGALYRVTVTGDQPPMVEKLNVNIGMAQGLLYAFDALYVMASTPQKAGLYRVTDTTGDDQPDTVELLHETGGGNREHGPHAILKHPDGKRLTVVCGNQVDLQPTTSSVVPRVWGEDHLIARVPDGNGFMAGVLAPGGCMYHVDPDGKNWELASVGFRNQYDAAYNRAGELFTFDADMEWDMNTPWYRPTRVCHVVPGSEWGWRNGAGKFRKHYPDNLPPVVNIGPGSPTGVCFGYDAKFPAKYQNALFISDWSYGKLYAVHLRPNGATYTGEPEEFVSGTPLPLTDVVTNPVDGAMYFAVGGRKTQSGLYRVTYTGSEPTAPATDTPAPTPEARTRQKLEALINSTDSTAIDTAWAHLGSPDRFVRFAARTVLESHADRKWHDRAVQETDPAAALNALLAVVRTAAPCPDHDTTAKPQPALRARVLEALHRLDFAALTSEQQADFVRVLSIALHRLGEPTAEERQALLARFEPLFPTGNPTLDGGLVNVLVYLQSPTVAAKGVEALESAATQEEQIELAMALRKLTAGWTRPLQERYFGWFNQAAAYKGGNSFQGFLRLIKTDAVAALSEADKAALNAILTAPPTDATAARPPRPLVQKWTLAELAPQVEPKLASGRDYDRGRRLFGAVTCFSCHRYDNEGGSTGPDLSGVAGRFSPRDLLESILDPSKEVSDQYAAVEIQTLAGQSITGRIVNLQGDNVMVMTDGLDPNSIATINRNDIDTMQPSKLSMMPAGLLDTMTTDEVADLMAYLLSRGDRGHPAFRK